MSDLLLRQVAEKQQVLFIQQKNTQAEIQGLRREVKQMAKLFLELLSDDTTRNHAEMVLKDFRLSDSTTDNH